jgi:riboflavin kinase/FMN adenylyltransferase
MITLEYLSQIKSLNLQNLHCTLGVFDGVHLGHQKLISYVVNSAKKYNRKSVVITFDKHPYTVINPSVQIPILTIPSFKLSLIEALGIDICIMVKFNKSIASIPAETWIKETLWEGMHIEAIYLGDDTSFGKGQEGNIDMLKKWGKKLGFYVVKLDMARQDKSQISSTSIRNLIQKGDLVVAERLLGRPYSIFGKHIKGRGLGKKIGFPTINLNTNDLCLPPNGIYAVYVDKDIPAVANLGISPTIGLNKKPVLELHMLTEKMPKDNNNIEVQFIDKIRNELKFESIPALTEQIKKDIEYAKNAFFPL